MIRGCEDRGCGKGSVCADGVLTVVLLWPEPNVALVAEVPWTDGASVGLFACVGPLVPRNVALVGEAP